MTPDEEALRSVIQLLHRHQIPYMLTGSMAASYHGRPRATHDADLVIDPSSQQLEDFVADLDAAGFYVDDVAARAALAERRQFNVIEAGQACKIDLIIRKDRAFSREEFARRVRVDLSFERGVAMVTPEDLILAKLEWARRSDSERQLRDAAGVLELNAVLDRAYIERWAAALGVFDLWRTLAETADKE